MAFTEKELDRNVSQLTVRELMGLIESFIQNTPKKEKVFDDTWINGVRELADFLSCSPTTIWRRVKNKDFEGAYLKVGKRYWFNRNKIIERMEGGSSLHDQ